MRAGLSCARQLRAKGIEVVVLEGNDRPGGRVYSMQLEVHTITGCLTRLCTIHWLLDMSVHTLADCLTCLSATKRAGQNPQHVHDRQCPL